MSQRIPRRMISRAARLLLLLPVTAALLLVGAPPSQAAGESWHLLYVSTSGCEPSDMLAVVETTGLDAAGGYTARMTLDVGGKTYMNRKGVYSTNTTEVWQLSSSMTYGPVANPGTWPLPAGQQVRIRMSLERPLGTVLSSWTVVLSSCDRATVRYNGPTAEDVDEDLVPVVQDKCPTLKAFTENGCPVRSRSLSLAAKYRPKRVVGTLSSPYAALRSGRPVRIYKSRSGPDLLVRTVTTNSLGRFTARVGRGRFYAVSPALIAPQAGQATAATSRTVGLR